MIKNSCFLLLIIGFTSLSIAQNSNKRELTQKTIDSLEIQFVILLQKIELKRKTPPIPVTKDNKKAKQKENTSNDQCGTFVKSPQIRPNTKKEVAKRNQLTKECGVFVTNVIERYGWLSISQVGERMNTDLGIIIETAPNNVKEKYTSLIKISVFNNDSNATNYAKLVDNILVYNGELQRYGSRVGPNPFSDTFEMRVYEIKDPEYVNQRRKEIGLNTIQEYLKTYDIVWDIPQKED